MNSDLAMAKNNMIACPACEYERNSQGQPVERDGQMKCLDCGSTWRVFGTAMKPEPQINQAPQKTRVRELADQVNFNTVAPEEFKPAFIPKASSELKSYKPGFGTLMSCVGALMLFAGLYLGLLFLEQDHTAMPADALYISEVKIEEQVRQNGEKVFTVKGLVANPTGVSKPIPSIAIILRQHNGSEITRWHYNSALASLRAGGKSRFASSIQYDTPIVAYAEAVFK